MKGFCLCGLLPAPIGDFGVRGGGSSFFIYLFRIVRRERDSNKKRDGDAHCLALKDCQFSRITQGVPSRT